MATSKPRKRIGPYRITGELGAGGMGVVWRAVHEGLKREVAIKELAGKSARDKEALERFRREGMALAQLKHECIVGIHDLFPAADRLWMVLELVDGFALGALVKEQPLPWDVAAIVGLSIASGLEHAHHHKVIHRDVKPSNILVGKDGEVKLMDFGIARDQLLDDLTRTGFVVGTPAYLSPEVVRGGKGDALGDVWSLGVTLYECVSGARPFREPDTEENLRAILSGRHPPLGEVAGGLPKRFRTIVEKCMRVNPKKRFKGAAELRLELELLLAEHGSVANHRARMVGFLKARGRISETEALTCIDASDLVLTSFTDVPTPRSRWRGAAAGLVVALALGAGGWWIAGRPDLVSRIVALIP